MELNFHKHLVHECNMFQTSNNNHNNNKSWGVVHEGDGGFICGRGLVSKKAANRRALQDGDEKLPRQALCSCGLLLLPRSGSIRPGRSFFHWWRLRGGKQHVGDRAQLLPVGAAGRRRRREAAGGRGEGGGAAPTLPLPPQDQVRRHAPGAPGRLLPKRDHVPLQVGSSGHASGSPLCYYIAGLWF